MAIADHVRSLSSESLGQLKPGSAGYDFAFRSLRRPVDYMRNAEFAAVTAQLQLRPGMKVLDLSSPQWFSLTTAARRPEVQFTYANILESEIKPMREVAESCGIRNLDFVLADARELAFEDASFDCVISISVLEHIAPAEGGDLMAFKEIRRVLKDDGLLHLTLPFKDRKNTVYLNGEVYERAATEKNFFAREYDGASFESLVQKSRFELSRVHYVVEKPGLFALDYLTWGPGRGRLFSSLLVKSAQVLERMSERFSQDRLAHRYLKVSDSPVHRLTNVVATLRKSRGS